MNGHDAVAGRDARIDVRIPAHPSFGAVRVTVAHSFPSLAQLSACRVHRTHALSQCVPISNPATGSASLTAAFESIPELAAGQRYRLQYPVMDSRMRVTKTNSSHALNVGGMQTWLQRRRPKHWRRPAQCIVMTVRDPAERFESAFRDTRQLHEARATGDVNPLDAAQPHKGHGDAARAAHEASLERGGERTSTAGDRQRASEVVCIERCTARLAQPSDQLPRTDEW